MFELESGCEVDLLISDALARTAGFDLLGPEYFEPYATTRRREGADFRLFKGSVEVSTTGRHTSTKCVNVVVGGASNQEATANWRAGPSWHHPRPSQFRHCLQALTDGWYFVHCPVAPLSLKWGCWFARTDVINDSFSPCSTVTHFSCNKAFELLYKEFQCTCTGMHGKQDHLLIQQIA